MTKKEARVIIELARWKLIGGTLLVTLLSFVLVPALYICGWKGLAGQSLRNGTDGIKTLGGLFTL